ncbi:helix-turn-helix domain-containing protein [Nonomuraea sp. NPDC050404]|uniref:winged helix-turn-helix transcriptional regulator n=1 Tax=Nonomuraea sp. NPDC050404 TaxID=3155783 RepID=UPI00340FD3B6
MSAEAPAEPYNAFLVGCPARQLFDRISDKWVGLTLSALARDSRRYSELSRTITGVSQKMLTQTLRNLERDGLVSRTVTPTVPVRVDYELTELGRSLLPAVQLLKGWAEGNIERVQAARETYDAQP